MTKKMKVSREVADEIGSFRSEFGDETLLCRHAQGWEDHEPLCKLSMVDLATALIAGYEVEMTPHEIIKTNYDDALKIRNETHNNLKERFSDGYLSGVDDTLEALGITVKGVNDNVKRG